MILTNILPLQLSNSLTNFCHDTTNDKLFFASGFHSGTEFGIVPRIHLALTADKSGIGVHFRDLLEQEAVWTSIGGRSQNSRNIEDFSNSRMSQHVIAEIIRAVVAD